jgi:hypothetical protein
MRLSRRLTGVLLVLAFAGALAPGALAGKRKPTPPAPPTSSTYVVPGSGVASMIDIEALR